MFLVYSGDNEIMVVAPQFEDEFKKKYFETGGRNIDDYVKTEVDTCIEITSEVHFWIE